MNVGVVGAGSIGRRHAANLRRLGHDVVLTDLDPDRARAVAAGLDAEHAASPPLDRLDAVVVCTPPGGHAAPAVAALDRGVPVLVEKPLAHAAADARAVVAAAEASGAAAMVACNMRFHPGPAAVKRAVDDGTVGTVLAARLQSGSYLPRWRPGTDHARGYSASPVEGGALLDCIHEIDLAQWYLGPARLVGSVVRPAASIGVAADGLAELLLEHGAPGAGPVSNVHLNFVQRDYRRTCQVIGTEGTVYWDFAGTVRVHGPDGGVASETDVAAGWEVNDMYVAELEHFLGCVRAGAGPMNPPAEAERTLALALRARGGAP